MNLKEFGNLSNLAKAGPIGALIFIVGMAGALIGQLVLVGNPQTITFLAAIGLLVILAFAALLFIVRTKEYRQNRKKTEEDAAQYAAVATSAIDSQTERKEITIKKRSSSQKRGTGRLVKLSCVRRRRAQRNTFA
jgi:hypothetical protein